MARRAAEIFQGAKPRKVVLSGGTTPRRAYELMSDLPMSWREIDLFMSDERWVPPDDERSNARMITEALGSRFDEARFHPIPTSGFPRDAARSYAALVAKALPIDLTFLGMGPDGHTASLFAEVPNYERTDVFAFAHESEAIGVWRVTLSLRALNESSHVVFLIIGEEKSKALADVLSGTDVPAAKVNPVGQLTILADKAAAS